MEQQIRFCTASDGVTIAYATVGEGPPVVYANGWPTHLEVAHIVGIFNYLTRLADGFGLQLDAGTSEASESGLALRRPE